MAVSCAFGHARTRFVHHDVQYVCGTVVDEGQKKEIKEIFVAYDRNLLVAGAFTLSLFALPALCLSNLVPLLRNDFIWSDAALLLAGSVVLVLLPKPWPCLCIARQFLAVIVMSACVRFAKRIARVADRECACARRPDLPQACRFG